MRSRTKAIPAPQSAVRQNSPERILQRLDWQIIRRLDGLLQGDYRSLFYGYGVDFADLREYQPGDDIRYIDWNVTARMDAPYIRQYMEDREITAWFLVDLSPSMDFGSDSVEKRAVLIDLVGTLARLLTRHGNRVGAIIFNEQDADNGSNGNGRRKDRVLPARSGRNHVLQLIHELIKQPRLSFSPLTNLNAMLSRGLMTIRKRSLVFILSDFISAPGWERPLNLLARNHEVLAIRLWDPREVELPDAGPLWMEDAETGEQLYVDTSDRKFRAQFELAVQQRENGLKTAFRHAGVEPWSLSTHEDLVHAILRYSAARKQLHRLNRSAHANAMAGTAR